MSDQFHAGEVRPRFWVDEWYAICECRWRGPNRITYSGAAIDLRRHLFLAIGAKS